MPDEVTMMNTIITFVDLDTPTESTITLKDPHAVKGSVNAISMLAPVGGALPGLRVGETIEWPLPNGRRR